MRNHALNLKSKKEPYHVNSPFALPKSTSLLFSVITPPFKLHFHLFFVCDTLSNCARTRFPLCVSVPGAPRASSSESELRVSPFSFSVCFSVAFLASSPAADPVVWSTLGTSSVFCVSPSISPALRFTPFSVHSFVTTSPSSNSPAPAFSVLITSTKLEFKAPLLSSLCSQSVASVLNAFSSSCSVLKSALTPSTTFRMT
mmetsp:Transcript_6223/g.20878  ORF Transcript_6223/g.20878 Transcript_6223/m.20878 type:complete len:200 (+) Transcript_6223:656-1255(+)